MAGTAPLPTRDVSANALWFPGAYLCTARRFRPFRLTFRAVDSRLVRLRPRTASKSCLSCVALLPLRSSLVSSTCGFLVSADSSARNFALTRFFRPLLRRNRRSREARRSPFVGMEWTEISRNPKISKRGPNEENADETKHVPPFPPFPEEEAPSAGCTLNEPVQKRFLLTLSAQEECPIHTFTRRLWTRYAPLSVLSALLRRLRFNARVCARYRYRKARSRECYLYAATTATTVLVALEISLPEVR